MEMTSLGVDRLFLDITLVMGAAALMSWVALQFRQPIIIGYLLCGVVVGPWGLGLIEDVEFVREVGGLGVTLLLFLAGIVLHPRRLLGLFRESALVIAGTCGTFVLVGGVFAKAWGFGAVDALLVGLALMFSSTILVVKLLPTTTLHQQHLGETCVAILVAQDLIAVGLLLFMSGSSTSLGVHLALLPVKGALILGTGLLVEQYVIRRMMARSERFHETLYVLAFGWCLGMATFAEHLGFSHEVGAFVAGMALARGPFALFLSERLKPFRDFFLVLFFFALGAELDLLLARDFFIPAVILAAILLCLKPLVFSALFRKAGETREFSREAGVRLGQASEFSLIVSSFAYQMGHMAKDAEQLVHLVAILTLAVSAYVVVFKYPSPLGAQDRLQRD